ncbi:MAG TPA: pyridoxal phosphate-dependent aminotransferase [Stellaceae bacterium]|nr:pyridoxal phosphate-dependent aminotransferase [Stellaceae bacterium]
MKIPGRPAGVRPIVAALPFTPIGQLAMAGMGDPTVVPLWYGESDVPTPAFICEAAAAALRAGETFYTFKRGIPELRQAIAAYLTRLHARPVTAERVIVTSSGMSAVMLLAQALIEPGDNAVIIAPIWPNIADAVTVMGGAPRLIALAATEAGGWRLDLDRLFAAVDAMTRALFVNSPGNPTGWTMSRDEARALLSFARERGIWLVADEVYSRLVYDGSAAAPSLLDLAEPEDRVIVINSFSKAWAMTGWRLGWMVAPREIQDVADKLVEFNTSCAPPFLQRAGIAALEQGEPVVAAMRERCRRGRDIMVQGLARFSRVRFAAPAGAFYAFFRVEGVSDSLAFAKEILARVKVGLAPGCAFGPAGEGYLRLCFANAPERLEEALARLAPVLG